MAGLASLSLGRALTRASAAAEPTAWAGFPTVIEAARQSAARPYVAPPERLPSALAKLSYDQLRDIRFRPAEAMWRDEGLPFRAHFFHLGYLFKTPIRINQVAGDVATPIPYQAEKFDYGKNSFAEPLPEDLGFAGFRLHYPLNRADVFDEVAVFLGASYFRVLGRDLRYGASARGLAIDTAEPQGEEFPIFREFWLEKPAPDASTMTIHALLDGPSVAGAYRMLIAPGERTSVDVESWLFFRRPVRRLGIAPLTSMYFFGENDRDGVDDFRPEVHDTDGLQIAFGSGEWLWRPVANPRTLRVSAYGDTRLRGFGLLQRDRDYRSYEDLEARYELRPSYWVEPLTEWGPGSVQLVEIPSDRETHDNIVALWVPDQAVEAGTELCFEYRLWSCKETPQQPGAAQTVQTRTGLGGVPDKPAPEGTRKFVIEFAGGQLGDLQPESKVEAVVTVSSGLILGTHAEAMPRIGGWRAFFDFLPAAGQPAELRCFLRAPDGGALTETWSYRWQD